MDQALLYLLWAALVVLAWLALRRRWPVMTLDRTELLVALALLAVALAAVLASFF